MRIEDHKGVKKAEVQPGFDTSQLQAILNVLPAYTWYATPSGALAFVNKRTADYLQLSKDHPLRCGVDTGTQEEDLIRLLHPDDREKAHKYWSDCLRTRTAGAYSLRFADAQGVFRWFLNSFEPLRASDGSVLLWVGANLDIEELKRAEEALRESERKLRQFIESVPAHFWSASPDGKATHVNQRLLDYFGIRLEDQKPIGPEDQKPSNWLMVIHPDDAPETERAFNHALQTGEPFQREHRLRRRDGEYRWHRARAEPLRDHEGHIIQWYGFSVDIDEAKKAEEQLRRSEANLAEAQRLSRTGSWALSPSTTKIFYWSEECYRIWGFDPAQGLPNRETVWRRIHPNDRARVLEEAEHALREKRDYSSEFRIVLPDGTVKHLEAIGHHLFSADGELVQIVGTNVDVTERKRAQDEHEKLRQLESELAHMNRVSVMGELAASLAHEITQPIASARNNARAALNFLDKQLSDVDEVREALGCVVGDADRAGDILDRVREQIKKAPPRKDHFDLRIAINEVMVLARDAIIQNGVSVQTRLADGLVPIQGDRVQLQQVVLNLILNAVEAMGSVEAGPRELLISAEQDHAGFRVAVRDSGPGIDAAHLDRVFDAFYTTKPKGTGMGLSICRSIVDSHGGRLWAELNAPRGTVFQFTLPSAEK